MTTAATAPRKHRINWNNLTEVQAARLVGKLARRYGWERAAEIARKELEADEVDDILRQAHAWLDGLRPF